MNQPFSILSDNYLADYAKHNQPDWEAFLSGLGEPTGHSRESFEFYIQAAAVYSSNIEGNSIDFDTYLKNKKFSIKQKPKETAEIDDLVEAYNFAMDNALTADNFLTAHGILSKTLLNLKTQRGKLRKQAVGIFSGGKIEYMAVEAEFVKQEFNKLFADITLLLNQDLPVTTAFYYASYIHLAFEKIHPFMDGNGRAGRLLEKWFLAKYIGPKAWALPTEKYYAQNRTLYYQHIHIGLNYYVLKWERALPFLLMLPQMAQEELTKGK